MAKVKELITPVDPEVDVSQLNNGENVIIEVPICRDTKPVPFCLHIDTRLTSEQSNVLRKTAAALDRQQARLACGKRIVHPTDAVKFILERLAEAT